jgi:O-antigen/teichoic acid export membrane protein
MSLLHAAYARFFTRGESGIDGSTKFARELIPVAAVYSALAGVALAAGAPLVRPLLGSSYAGAASAVRWLALLPLILCFYYLGGDALTGANHQGLRTALQLGAAVLNVALNLWLIASYSWRGAAWSTLISIGVLAAAMWIATFVLVRRDRGRGVERSGGVRLAGVQ